MPATNAPILTADSESIWREDAPGQRSGIAWDEIYSVSGSKIDRITRVVIVLTLDWDNGDFFELMDDWPGFEHVVREMSSRLPGIGHDWIGRIRSLSPRDETIQVWQRA